VPCRRWGRHAYGPGMSRIPRRAVVGRSLMAVLVATVVAISRAAVAEAHVNRTVGPYTILVILVEEPTFEDNHAGFQFWVRKDGVPITGLEQSVNAVAIGHDRRVELPVPPLAGSGFYVLDRSADGAPFDPMGGGAWTLFLSGSIEGTPLDASFPVIFPSYPRVAVADAPPAAAAVPAAGASLPGLAMVIPVAALVVLGGIALLALARRRRPGAPKPT
jgi:hypothetical protein